MLVKLKEIELYYEKQGSGTPLILIHGNGEDHTIFQELQKLLINFETYAIDSRDHGRSTQTNQLHYTKMADDLIDFIEAMNLKEVTVLGYSDGGIVALEAVRKKSERIKRIIACGVNMCPRGLTKEVLASIKLENKMSPSKYLALMINEPNISKRVLRKINTPIHFLFGEHDVIKKSHQIMLSKTCKNATLEIIPNEDHGSYILNNKKLFTLINKYLID